MRLKRTRTNNQHSALFHI